MGFLSFVAKLLFYGAILFCILAYSPFFLDYNPVAYSSLLPEELVGPLAMNDKLNDVDRLLEGDIKWPESLAVYEGKIYTGVSDGRIMKIDGVRATTLTRTGKKCDGPWDEAVCGRPLGMRINKDGILHVVDASYGLLAFDLKKDGNLQPVIPSNTVVENHNLTLLNDLVLDEDSGVIYMTQSSTRYPLTMVVYILMEPDRSGRLLAYNTKTKEINVLAKNLAISNGIELSSDKKKLLVAECSNLRVLQYHLSGPKKGQLEPFLSNLPGEPDNIRRSKSGGYWIAINNVRTKSNAALVDHLSEYPLVRKVLMRLIHAVGSGMKYATQYFQSPAFKELAFNVQTGRFLVDIIPANGMIIEVDNEGKILRALHSTKGIAHLSEVLEHDGYLYLGSWRNNFLGRIKA